MVAPAMGLLVPYMIAVTVRTRVVGAGLTSPSVTLTVVPFLTLSPAAGFWLATSPWALGLVTSNARPAPSMVVLARPCGALTTFGTVIRSGGGLFGSLATPFG